MKKNINCAILIGFLVLVSFEIKAQSFYKGAFVLDANLGLEVVNTIAGVQNPSTSTNIIKNDRAGSFQFNVGFEYAVSKRIGIGIRYQRHNFISNDSVQPISPVVYSNNFLAQLNLHAVTTKHFDLIIGADAGLSLFNYNDDFYGTGTHFSGYVNPRLYVGRFGFNLKLGLPFFKYNNLIANHGTISNNQTFSLIGQPGFCLTVGVQYCFGKNNN